MRANTKIILSFEQVERMLHAETLGTVPLHIISAVCDNDTGVVTFSALDFDARPLPEYEIAMRTTLREYLSDRMRFEDIHKCIAMPDGYLLRRHNNGDWYYQHLGDSLPSVEYCPHCGEKLR